jgi:hypothetical protein
MNALSWLNNNQISSEVHSLNFAIADSQPDCIPETVTGAGPHPELEP